MLMLTHTWLLMEVIGDRLIDSRDLDIFSYNIVPDILSIHKNISSTLTHGISRFQEIPDKFRKASYVQFHLMVDDISHYGKICDEPVTEFVHDAGGYSYVKGRSLIPGLIDLYAGAGQALTLEEAAYRSHMIVEIAFDHVVVNALSDKGIIDRFCESLAYTVKHDIGNFCDSIKWLYGIEEKTAEEAICEAQIFYSMERMKQIKNIESRTTLFIKKFGLDCDNDSVRRGVRELIVEGTVLAQDYNNFLPAVVNAMQDAGLGKDDPYAMPLS